MSKFQADFVVTGPSNPVLDLKLWSKLHMLSNVCINERHESLLVKAIRRALTVSYAVIVTCFYDAIAMGAILNVHIAADDRFWSCDEWLGIDQTAWSGGAEG